MEVKEEQHPYSSFKKGHATSYGLPEHTIIRKNLGQAQHSEVLGAYAAQPECAAVGRQRPVDVQLTQLGQCTYASCTYASSVHRAMSAVGAILQQQVRSHRYQGRIANSLTATGHTWERMVLAVESSDQVSN